MKLLKHGEAGQQCKKHTLIGFSRKYTIKFALAMWNNSPVAEGFFMEKNGTKTILVPLDAEFSAE